MKCKWIYLEVTQETQCKLVQSCCVEWTNDSENSNWLKGGILANINMQTNPTIAKESVKEKAI